MIHQVKITADNAHRLLKDRKITAEEHAEFMMNFLYETTLDEETRSKIRIPKVQDNGSRYENIPTSDMSVEEISYAINVLKLLVKVISNVESDVKARHLSRTGTTYDDNLVPYYKEYVYSFEELAQMCHKYLEQAQKTFKYIDYSKLAFSREDNEKRLRNTFYRVWDDCGRIAMYYHYDIMIGGWQFA